MRISTGLNILVYEEATTSIKYLVRSSVETLVKHSANSQPWGLECILSGKYTVGVMGKRSSLYSSWMSSRL